MQVMIITNLTAFADRSTNDVSLCDVGRASCVVTLMQSSVT